MIDTKYFKEYRTALGFTNQQNAKSFFAAKDITPTVDYNYIELLNNRLVEIITKINEIVVDEIKVNNLNNFLQENINLVCSKLKKHNIIPKLNNQGRRPEEVYFSWMRGFVITNYFLKAISIIFEVDINKIKLIGDDDLDNIAFFKRTPKADLEIQLKNNEKIRIEIQSGFQGTNDIKQHKVLEAKRIKLENNISSLVMHIDLFNGQVAFVKLDTIEEDNLNWITRQQMEGQTVFNIEQNYFQWKLIDCPPSFKSIEID